MIVSLCIAVAKGEPSLSSSEILTSQRSNLIVQGNWNCNNTYITSLKDKENSNMWNNTEYVNHYIKK